MPVPAVFAATALIALFASLACNTGVPDSVQTARELAGDVVTRTALEVDGPGESEPIPVETSPEVSAVINQLNRLEVAGRDSGIAYQRSDWRHWIDSDGDCQNTRAEALIEESRSEVSFATDENCRVTAGEWLGPWSAEIFTDASDVDVDHHVPLAHAHDSGGWEWERTRKRNYANDLSNPVALQVTSASVNRSKGKQPPDQWRPEVRSSWCRYAADWISVKSQWDLTVTEAEALALGKMLETCGEPGSWGLAGGPQR